MTARTPFAPGHPAPHPAAERQRRASDPRRSTWLMANAGSGKTRVLTDRVARLLLGGTDPQTILCLTYTKAAAAEMQERLFRRLGGWSMMADRDLRGRLGELGLAEGLGDANLREARRLFAQALETPGGLKIQTIHAFCASLLRRFPLEAGVSPQFRELEDQEAARLRAAVAEEMALGPHAPLLDDLARHLGGARLDELLAGLAARREAFAPAPGAPGPAEAELRAALGLDAHHCEEGLLACIGTDARRQVLRDLVALCETGSKTDQEAAAALKGVCAAARHGLDTLAALEELFLFRSGEKAGTAKVGAFPTAKLRRADPALAAELDQLMAEVEAARDARLGLAALGRSRSLHAFAAAFVGLYEGHKLARGLLDFDDLIGRARALLNEPSVAQWVLWRLDGGIDHILVDEAQDTSPAQWAVIERLADEFAAGEGARPARDRTIFVVGDRKQSIFSFQGADAQGFDRMKGHFADRLGRVGRPLREEALEHSFRSAAAVLRVVDETFGAGEGAAPDEALGGVPPHHVAFHDRLPGRVDLWPPVVVPKEERATPRWTEPLDRVDPEGAALRLARQVAEAVEGLLGGGTLPVALPAPGGGAGGPGSGPGGGPGAGGWARRPVTPGDVLILVQRRSALFAAIIRELKARRLDVAGADRLKLRAELAVRDLEAVLRFLALPEDSLALAAALKSPLFGWTEAQLYALAQPRPEGWSLWDALSRGPPSEALGVLRDLRDRADFLRPFDLLGRLLVRHDGRRRLLGRLGDEAEDGIDALLSQALAYEGEAVPSLTGFLEWRGQGEVEVKRQLDAAGDRIRVMTVHGAKGLEAPIVILPDAGRRADPKLPPLYPVVGADGRERVLWAPVKAEMPRALLARQAELLRTAEQERRRLLYVAMTRAQSWLIVGAAGEAGPESWHGAVRAGLERAGAVPHPFAEGMGLRYDEGGWDHLPPAPGAGGGGAGRPVGAAADAALGPAPPAPARVAPLAPSDLGGAKALAGEAAAPGPWEDAEALEEEARARGRLLHLALEHLPRLAGEDGAARVLALLQASPDAAGVAGDVAAVLEEARALVAAPHLAALWAPRALAEAALTADVPPLGRLRGAVDRLLVAAGAVTAVDFKSNRAVPIRPEDVPEGILRQMGAYAAMLRALYPGREVRTQVLWTATATLMDLPAPLVAAALVRAGQP